MSDPLKGWIFNHAQQSEDDEGAWEIGYINEDDLFYPIITVDTGLYYQEQAAEPMAKAILAMLQQRAAPAPVQQPLSEELMDALRRLWPLIERATKGYVFTAEKAGEVMADMNAVKLGIKERP